MAHKEENDPVIERLTDKLNDQLRLQPHNESTQQDREDNGDQQPIGQEIATTSASSQGERSLAEQPLQQLNNRSTVGIFVCNTDGSNRNPKLVDSDKSGNKITDYLIQLILPEIQKNPRGSFLVFLSEFYVSFIQKLSLKLKLKDADVDVGYIAVGVNADVTAILFNKSGPWQPVWNIELSTNRFVPVMLEHSVTRERLLCISVHLPHKDEIDAAWKALKSYLATKMKMKSCKYIVVAGDFNTAPKDIQLKPQLPRHPTQFAISSDSIKTCKYVTYKDGVEIIISESSIDNVVTFGPVTPEVTVMNGNESLFTHYPISGCLQFTAD